MPKKTRRPAPNRTVAIVLVLSIATNCYLVVHFWHLEHQPVSTLHNIAMRLQQRGANRSSADDAAKAAMLAEIRELKSKRGLLQFFDGAGGQVVAAPDVQTGGNPRSPKGGKGGKTESPKGKGKYLVADFDPSSGLKPKTEQSARAAGVVGGTGGRKAEVG